MSLTGNNSNSSADLGSNIFTEAVTRKVDSDGEVQYACGDITETNMFPTIVIPYVYDLVYQCSIAKDDAVRYIASRLLNKASDSYDITPDGARCNGEAPESDSSFQNWILAVDSSPPDKAAEQFLCSKASAWESNECCTVVEGSMTFTPSPVFDADELSMLVMDTLDSDELTLGTAYRTFFVGYELVQPTPCQNGNNNSSDCNAVNDNGNGSTTDTNVTPVVDSQSVPKESSGTSISAVGGVIMAGLVVVLLLFSFFVFRRRRQKQHDTHVNNALAKSTIDMGDDVAAPTIEIDVLSDGRFEYNMGSPYPTGGSKSLHTPNSAATPLPASHDYDQPASPDFARRNQHRQEHSPSSEGSIQITGNSEPRNGSVNQSNYEYSFDLSDALRQDVMGTHARDLTYITGLDFSGSWGSSPNMGPTSMAVAPPYPMEETSDSDVDSWAQTDATVGSIDDRLEDITAEI